MSFAKHHRSMFFYLLIVGLVVVGQHSSAAAGGSADASTSNPSKPNVVIFLADDLGIGDVGCFGNLTIKTPNIDRIAREGAKLTHHLAASSLCTPSRAALLTGRYPIRSGMVARHDIRVGLFTSSLSGIPPNETTFAEVAKSNGYSTALVGKWHLGMNCGNKGGDFCHHPLKSGFDFFYGIPLTNLMDFGDDGLNLFSHIYKNLNSFLISVIIGAIIGCSMLKKYKILGLFGVAMLAFLLVFPTLTVLFVVNNMKLLNSMVMRNFETVEQPIHFLNFTQRLVKEGVNYIEERSKDEKPFLLMMSWLQVHTVLHTSDEFKGHSKHGSYGDNVEEMDWSTGEIVNALERLGLLDNTLVYFTSDNGGHLEEKGIHGNQEGGWNGIYRGSKGQGGMDGGIRVPTVMMWRGHIKPGTVIDVPTSLMDVFPTLQSAVWNNRNSISDRIIDGQNIYPLLTGADSTPPHRLLVHYCGSEIHAARYTPGDGSDVYKVHYVTPNWIPGTQGCEFICRCGDKHVTRQNPPLMYNIGKDPSEQKMLPTTEPYYENILRVIQEKVKQHIDSIDYDVPSQFAVATMLPRLWLQPCCNFPFCKCIDPTYADVTNTLNKLKHKEL